MENISPSGDIPTARFGHTVTLISKTHVVLYGGAIGLTEKYTITGETFKYNIQTRKWSKITPKGETPPNRAAHGACAVEDNKMVIFGGAMGGGGSLVPDDLYLLDLSKSNEEESTWIKIPVTGPTPGRRYGHTLVYSKPHLIVFGGNTGSEPVSDTWVLAVDKSSLSWQKIECPPPIPIPRVYHSASLCTNGSATGMVVIFGGRGGDGAALNDTWGFRRHRDGKFDWVKAPPYKAHKSEPTCRYQHQTLFVGPLMFVIGGRGNSDTMTGEIHLEVYDTETSDWTRITQILKFRHASWYTDGYIYIHGGFDHRVPNIPTDVMCKIYLQNILQAFPQLLKSIGMASSAIIGTPQINSSGVKPVANSPMMQDKQSSSAGYKPPKSASSQNKDFSLAKHAMVAENYGQNTDTRHVPVDKLPEESKKIGMLSSENKISQQTMYHENLYNLFLNQLLKPGTVILSTQKFNIKKEIILKLIEEVQKILESQETLARVSVPVKIFGNLYGQYGDLMRFFESWGCPNNSGRGHDIEGNDYIFLGNYVGRGKNSLEVITLLLALKLKFPQQIHLLRGSHEDERVNTTSGFGEECQTRLQEDIKDVNSVFQKLNRLFEYFPIAALLEDKVLCVHSGIGTSLRSVDEITSITKPYRIPRENTVQQKREKIIQEILWSIPSGDESERVNNGSGTGNVIPELKFSKERIGNFLNENRLDLIVRSRECVNEGYEKFGNTNLYTVFSCTNYGGTFQNKAGLLAVKKNYEITPKLIEVSSNSTLWYPAPEEKSKLNSSSKGSMELENDDMKNRPLTPPRARYVRRVQQYQEIFNFYG